MNKGKEPLAAQRWDVEYREGKYQGEGPVPFVNDILATLEAQGLVESNGLYVGCGNGRNYIPLIDAGLRLTGLDISAEALSQIEEQRPNAASQLVCEDFAEYQPEQPLDYVISLQVFQHGNLQEVARHFRKTRNVLKHGGLFFLRVNSTTTDILHRHTVLERSPEGGTTIRYDDGPKDGLDVHFYSKEELQLLTEDNFTVVMPLREAVMPRQAPKTGNWVQWEGIWDKL